MLLVKSNKLASRHDVRQQLVDVVGLAYSRAVAQGLSFVTVLLRQFAIDFDGEVILSRDLLSRKAEYCRVAVSKSISVGQGIECAEKSRHRWINLYRPGGKQPGPRRKRRHRINVRDSKRLAQPLVVREEKSSTPLDRPAYRCPELIPLEGRNLGVKEVSRIQGAVAKEFISSSVESIGPGAGHRVDNT